MVGEIKRLNPREDSGCAPIPWPSTFINCNYFYLIVEILWFPLSRFKNRNVIVIPNLPQLLAIRFAGSCFFFKEVEGFLYLIVISRYTGGGGGEAKIIEFIFLH